MNVSDIQREKPNCLMRVRDGKNYDWSAVAYYPLTDEGLSTFEDARRQDDVLEVYVAVDKDKYMLNNTSDLASGYFDHYGKLLIPAKDIKFFRGY